MRFFLRGLAGLMILALTLGLLAFGAGRVTDAMRQRAEDAARPRPVQERIASVAIDRIRLGPAHPVITAYGRIEAPGALEIRAAVAGPVVALAPDFRDGGRVEAGALMVRIDPADARSARDRAAADLKEAEAEAVEAAAALTLAHDDLAAATAQRDLRAQALDRQAALQDRRVSTEATVETAKLALAAAEQAVVGRRQALAQAEARIVRAGLARDRARLMLADADRALEETEIRAPFAGLVTGTAAVLGRRVTVNEPLGRLIDPQGMEVAFRVSTAEFARLIDAAGALRPLPVTAALALGPRTLTVRGTLVRAAAEVGAGQTGRLLHARLDLPPDTVLRPGDFLTLGIAEPPLTGVAVLPASAVTEDGRLLVLDASDRLAELALPVLRRQGATVILGEAPEGARYVVTRLPTLGAGLKVRPVMPDAAPTGPEMLDLSPERRAALIAAVEANTRMPAEARARLLARLREDRVPREMVERLEARMGG